MVASTSRIDLLWEEKVRPIRNYDTLVQREVKEPFRFLPGTHAPAGFAACKRWSEWTWCVNATVLKVDQAVALLDFIWDDALMPAAWSTRPDSRALDQDRPAIR